MATLIVRDGALVTQDPSDVRVYVFDWDTDNLADGVLITSSVFTVTRLSGAASPALTKDSESIQAGSRRTEVRLLDGVRGGLYQIDNTITTNESPFQVKERHFKLLIQQR
jgi:hypothetical protein